MVLLIIVKCINCDMCELECLNSVILMGDKIYEINFDLCIECKGYYDKLMC